MIKYGFYFGLPLVFIMMLLTARAEDTPEHLLESHLWQDRVVILLSQSEHDSDYLKQLSLLEANKNGLRDRDIILYDVVQFSHVKQDGAILPHVPASSFFAAFSPQIGDKPYTFIVLGKDGAVKHISHSTLATKDLFTLIDAMPMRENETKNK